QAKLLEASADSRKEAIPDLGHRNFWNQLCLPLTRGSWMKSQEESEPMWYYHNPTAVSQT
ncbi:UNVERIFIED_CONTAM: hypothetical protein K2H54_075998, partial [Gekko kuhli]